MKWTHIEMANWPDGKTGFEETLQFDSASFKPNGRLRDLKDVNISGSAYYDALQEHLYVEYTITGRMIVPDSITLEDVDYHFRIDDRETYSFTKIAEDEDAIEVKGEVVDTLPAMYASIMAEVPLVIHKDKDVQYPKGNGWEVMSEKQESTAERGIDPRLAKLLEYKPEEEE